MMETFDVLFLLKRIEFDEGGGITFFVLTMSLMGFQRFQVSLNVINQNALTLIS